MLVSRSDYVVKKVKSMLDIYFNHEQWGCLLETDKIANTIDIGNAWGYKL